MGARVTAPGREQDEALVGIASAAGEQLEELSLTDYRLLPGRSEEDLPAPPTSWARFGSYQRMRELALLRSPTDINKGG